MDSKVVLAGAIIFATFVGAWMLRYEVYGQYQTITETDLLAQFVTLEKNAGSPAIQN